MQTLIDRVWHYIRHRPRASVPRGWIIVALAVAAWLVLGLIGLAGYGLLTLLWQ